MICLIGTCTSLAGQDLNIPSHPTTPFGTRFRLSEFATTSADSHSQGRKKMPWQYLSNKKETGAQEFHELDVGLKGAGKVGSLQSSRVFGEMPPA